MCLGLCSGLMRSFSIGLTKINTTKANWCDAFEFVRQNGIGWSDQSVIKDSSSPPLISDELFVGNIIQHLMYLPEVNLKDFCYLICMPSHLEFVASCL
jgi:hypothetical protein